MRHELKTWPDMFQDIFDGKKKFELRKDDRNFQVGDSLLLKEYDARTEEYSGREIEVKISYILKNMGGLIKDYCILGIEHIGKIHP